MAIASPGGTVDDTLFYATDANFNVTALVDALTDDAAPADDPAGNSSAD